MNRFLIIWLLSIGPMLAAEPIVGVTAKATSTQVDKLFGAANLCSDVGLTDTGKGDGTRALTTNAYTGGGCMWHSGYIALGADEHPIVEFDLGKKYHVDRFHLWNYNSQPSRGFRQVAMMISDDGQRWHAVDQRFVFAKAPKKDDYTGEEHRFEPSIQARFIRFHCESTHRQGGNRDLAGLGKVRFYEAKTEFVPKERTRARFPSGSGIVNVRQAPYLAKGDGKTDDTTALQKAIDDWQGTGRTLYLPAGTYIVSQSLRYTPAKGHGYNNLVGDGPTKTILQLRDGNFTDVNKPQAVLSLGFNGRPDGKGVHADWFNNNVGQLAIDTGKNNPGAIALQYYSNNAGALRDVAVQSGDGQGAIGIDLGYADQNGPCLIKNITIDGFAVGVLSGATVNSQTAEFVTVKRCTKAGWENRGQCVSIRGLNVSGSGAGFINGYGVACLIDSTFQGDGAAKDSPAITNGETLFARNIKTRGYQLAIENKRTKDQPTPNAIGPNVDEWVSTPPLTLYPTAQPRSLNLPIKETPEVIDDEPTAWANIRAFRALSDPDDSDALQRAIDSGATTIFFPAGGTYYFGKPVAIRSKVKRIHGMFAHVNGVKGDALWRITAEGPSTVVLQDCRGHLKIEHDAKRTLVVNNGQGMGGVLRGGGEVFLENVVADWDFENGQAWARQFNNEREGTHITNRATLWILGLKTERGGTLIETKAGGVTELLGGLSYTTTKGKLAPMFVSTDAKVSYVIGEVCYSRDPYTQLVEERRGKDRKMLERTGVPLRPAFLQGSQLPLFVGHGAK